MSSDDTTLRLADDRNATENDTMAEFRKRLEELEGKFERRGYDTRPLWEKAQRDIQELQEDVQELESGVETLRAARVEQEPVEQEAARQPSESRVWCIQLYSNDALLRVEGKNAIEDQWNLVIYDGDLPAARFPRDDVKLWWPESASHG